MSKHFIPFRLGHGGVLRHNNSNLKRAPSASCTTGGFYISPTSGQVVKTTDPFNITWDSSCLNTTAVDIYLYAPSANQSRIQVWETVDFAAGNYQTNLKSGWWNNTQSINLQLAIVPSGTPAFLATLPAGPIFSASYTPSTSGDISSDSSTSESGSGVTEVNNLPTKGGISKGAIAAAVLVPLIVVAVAITFYVRYMRRKVAKKRERFSQAIDKRMSTISTDWRSMSAAGASAAIRHSMAISTNRASFMSYGGVRTSSTCAVESGQAGIGAGASYQPDEGDSQMSQIRRPGVGLRGPVSVAGAERVSRISFAADTRFSRTTDPRPSMDSGSRGRPSTESRRAGNATRSFHTSIIPPLPERKPSDFDSDSDRDDEGSLSPTQTQGALALTPEDIRARISGQDIDVRPSLDEVLPALSMMRTGGHGDNASTGDLLLSPTTSSPENVLSTFPSPPAAIVPRSPMIDAQPVPASMMSPDAMLRAYAERRVGTPVTSPGSPSFPAPVAALGANRNTMRTLYAPAGPPSTASLPSVGTNNPYRASMAVEAYRTSVADEDDYEDAYIGTAQ